MEEYIFQDNGKISIILFVPNFIDDLTEISLKGYLKEIRDWSGGEYDNYKIPRLQKWYHNENKQFNDKWGKAYPRWNPCEYPDWLKSFQNEIQGRIAVIMEPYCQKYPNVRPPNINSVLANYYPDEKFCIGWHRDNAQSLGVNPTIVSISIGDTRTFKMCRAESPNNRKPVEELFSAELTSGSLLVMAGNCQEHIHSVLKSEVPKKERWNFTFRETN